MNIEEKIKIIRDNYYTARDFVGTDYVRAIDTLINYVETMQKEFDRLEGIEDNTAMLKFELEHRDKVMAKMAEQLIHYDFDEHMDLVGGKEAVIQYFNKKIDKERMKTIF